MINLNTILQLLQSRCDCKYVLFTLKQGAQHQKIYQQNLDITVNKHMYNVKEIGKKEMKCICKNSTHTMQDAVVISTKRISFFLFFHKIIILITIMCTIYYTTILHGDIHFKNLCIWYYITVFWKKPKYYISKFHL